MKKLTSILLSMTLILTLAACGGGGNGGQNKEAPDLNQSCPWPPAEAGRVILTRKLRT